MALQSGFSHLPHINNVKAGMNKWDPMHQSIFEVYFTLPEKLRAQFADDELILTEQVIEVSGLDALQKTVQAGQQKFLGVDVSFLNPTLDQTFAEITIQFNLNLRTGNDAYVLKLFKAWSKLGYDLSDGTRTLMVDYCADNLRIAEGNRNGDIWRSYIFHKVLLTECSGLETLSYNNNEARILTCKFRADYWEEDLA